MQSDSEVLGVRTSINGMVGWEGHNEFTLAYTFINFNFPSRSVPQSLDFPSSGLMGEEGTAADALPPPSPGRQ